VDKDDIIGRLTCLWLVRSDRQPTRDEAEAFLAMWYEMQNVDREIAEQERVKHAREMSKPRR
jgi:hypothetical protein